MDDNTMRLGLYRKIEVARKQLPDMDDAAFRSLLLSQFGVESRKKMTVNQLARLAQLFARSYGVVYTAPAKSRNREVTPHGRPDWIEITDSMPFAAEKRQILAIWRKLGYSMISLDTRVRRAFGVYCFVWMQDWKQISTLLSDLQRREKSFDRKSAAKDGGEPRSGSAAFSAQNASDSECLAGRGAERHLEKKRAASREGA